MRVCFVCVGYCATDQNACNVKKSKNEKKKKIQVIQVIQDPGYCASGQNACNVKNKKKKMRVMQGLIRSHYDITDVLQGRG